MARMHRTVHPARSIFMSSAILLYCWGLVDLRLCLSDLHAAAKRFLETRTGSPKHCGAEPHARTEMNTMH